MQGEVREEGVEGQSGGAPRSPRPGLVRAVQQPHPVRREGITRPPPVHPYPSRRSTLDEERSTFAATGQESVLRSAVAPARYPVA